MAGRRIFVRTSRGQLDSIDESDIGKLPPGARLLTAHELIQIESGQVPVSAQVRAGVSDELRATEAQLQQLQAGWRASLRRGPAVRRLASGTPETASETELTQEAEAAYQRWIGQLVEGDDRLAERYARETPGQRHHQRLYDLPGTSDEYDYRGAFAEGADRTSRFPQRFEKPSNEPTADLDWLDQYMKRESEPTPLPARNPNARPDVPNEDEDWSVQEGDQPLAARTGPSNRFLNQARAALARRV